MRHRGRRFLRKSHSKQFAQQMALLWPEGVSNATTGRSKTRKNSPLVTIEALPDEILLYVFDLCRLARVTSSEWFWADKWPESWSQKWHKLVQVCRRWRYVVFSSPRRLCLRLDFSDRTCSKELLDAWPPIPIEISSCADNLGDNVVAALERHDRIRKIIIHLPCPKCDRLATVMQNRSPLLTRLQLSSSCHDFITVIPDTFLGGSAPRLRSLHLDGIPFPTLPQLLLSCDDLSELQLLRIPEIGYISPEAMVTGLSALTRLARLCIEFRRFETIRVRGLPPVTRAIFPALTRFEFLGVNEYLEDLLARIDAPQLEYITARIFWDHLDLQRVISHVFRLTHGPFERAEVTFSLDDVHIQLYRPNEPFSMLAVGFVEEALGQQILTITQLPFSLFSNITELRIGIHETSDELELHDSELDESEFENLFDHPGWLVLFHTFNALQTLHLCGEIQPLVIFSLLRHTVEGIAEVLPGLRNLYLHQWHWHGEPEQGLEQFVAARQAFDHPITVHHVPEYDDGDDEEE